MGSKKAQGFLDHADHLLGRVLGLALEPIRVRIRVRVRVRVRKL